MNGEIGVATYDDGLHLADEEPFAADLRERAILNSIPLGLHVDLFDLEIGNL